MDEPVTPRAQRRIIDLVHTAAEAFGIARAIVDESATCLTFLALREDVLRAAAAFVAAGWMWLARIPGFAVDPDGKVGMSSGVNGTVYQLPLVWRV
jgi:hypothetical protein